LPWPGEIRVKKEGYEKISILIRDGPTIGL